MVLYRRGIWAGVVLLLLALAATADASTRTLTIGAGFTRSCATAQPISGAGVATTRWTAPADSSVSVHLRGGGADDWDLALFDARTGARRDTSAAWGANEVVHTLARKGDTLVIQACRLRGSSARLPLTIDSVPVRLAAPGAKPAGVTFARIPLTSPLDMSALTSLGINLNEVPEGKTVAAVLGAGDAAKLARAGYTYETVTPQERSAKGIQAAQAEASPLPSGRTTYRDYPAIQADLKKLAADNPKLVRPITLPEKSFQGRDINGIELSANVARNDDGKPAFFLMGAHHAREWPSAEAPLEYALYLTQNYGKDKRVTRLLRRGRGYVGAGVKVDGYIASRRAADPAPPSGGPPPGPSPARAVGPPPRRRPPPPP